MMHFPPLQSKVKYDEVLVLCRGGGGVWGVMSCTGAKWPITART